MNIKVQYKGMKEFEDALEKLSKKAIFVAEREVTRKLAFSTQANAKRLVKKKFTIRSPYTVNSIRVRKLPKASEIGTLNEGLALQETGGHTSGKQGKNARITTSYAANQGLTAYPRTKTARGQKRTKRINIGQTSVLAHSGFGNKRKMVKPASGKQANWLRIRNAIATGKRFIYLDPGAGSHKGLYRVTGGNKRKPYSTGGSKAKLRLVHDLSEKSYRIRQRPWLLPATDYVMKKHSNRFYKEALDYQLRRP